MTRQTTVKLTQFMTRVSDMAGHGETVTGHQITGHSLLHSTLHLSLVEDWEMILVGLRETFIKRYIVEKTSKAE